ncbi:MAG: hypothetical protein ACON5D_00010, partial [Rubripirellula sp.]
VVPRPNPKFDESVFNAQSIGVQPGGLKMPREFIRDQAPKKQLGGTSLIESEKMLGWTVRSGSVSIAEEALQIKAESKQALLIHSAIKVDGAHALRIRIKTSKPITTSLQWRVAGQDHFPDTGQQVSLDLEGGQWEEISVDLPKDEKIIHFRFLLPKTNQTIKIDWIELLVNGNKNSLGKRWDF